MNQPKLLFCSGQSFVSRLIRIFTNPLQAFRGGYVPSHVATLAGSTIIESDIGRGVTCESVSEWKQRKQGQKVFLATMTDELSEYESTQTEMRLQSFIGTKYEELHELALTALDRNDDDANRIFCSELVVRAWPKWIFHRFSPDNTDPDELFRFCKNNGWKFEKVKL